MRFLKYILVIAALLSAAAAGIALAQTQANRKEMEAQKKDAESEIKETRTELKATEKKVEQYLNELRKIDDEIAVSQNEITTVQGQLKVINENISGLEESIAIEDAELERLRTEYLKAVKKMRVAKKKNSEIVFLFASRSFNEARRRMRYMQEFSEWRQRRSSEIQSKVDLLHEQRAQLVQAKNDAAMALKREEAAQEKLNRQKQEQQLAVNELQAHRETLKAKIEKKQAESKQLTRQISALIAEEKAREAEKQRKAEEARRKAEEEKRLAEEKRKAEEERRLAEEKRRAEEKKKQEEQLLAQENSKQKEKEDNKSKPKTTPAPQKEPEPQKQATEQKGSSGNGEFAEARKRERRSGSSTSGNETAGATFADMKGRLPKPVNGTFKIVYGFGNQPFAPGLEERYDNSGIDVHVAKGASANVVYEGEIINIIHPNTAGVRNIVLIRHGDYFTVYSNLETVSVQEGQKVKQGQSIGTIGEDFDDPDFGLLHFEVWRNQTQLDPVAWIK